ncbi:hypothetical protein H5410_029478 [Solanum commersonii]|uniref:Uncharacterized protein n=1 Tax=Solanum commersonii TaxID=4109 RepID=A0A9J5Z5R5_SOLCO|nr:hypothetical protein H5410_029478 [Solanum commersonii]
MVKSTTSDQMEVKSSISLLQERFKQLQKIKKMRQEKELLKNMLMHFDHHDVESYNNNKLYFHSELNMVSPINNDKSSSRFSLSLWPDIKSRNIVRSTPKLKCDYNSHSDVDTSLHL